MSLDLQAILVTKLHGKLTYSIPVENNQLLLIGLSGAGKTTIMNLIYLGLSQQWSKLLKYSFEKLIFIFNDEFVQIDRDDLFKLFSDAQIERLAFRLRYSGLKRPFRELNKLLDLHSATSGDELSISEISEILSLDELPTIDFIRAFTRSKRGVFPPEAEDSALRLRIVRKQLNSKLTGKILYLPTYRRIEKDLNLIFPELEEDIAQFTKKRGGDRDRNANAHIEFVEFGMKDVEDDIDRVLGEIRESSRTQIRDLAGSYLSDVIRGHAHTYKRDDLKAIKPTEVIRILNRIEEDVLPRNEKVMLYRIIRELKRRPSEHEGSSQDYAAYYFLKLVAVHDALVKKEEVALNFVNICNTYLFGKKLVFDNREYKIRIQLTGDTLLPPRGERPPRDPESSIHLKDLSSGEKQIVSLFSHLYLGENQSTVVLIDEPELSLNVIWQRKLLPDILQSGRCSFLAAATHSPFIFDNQLENTEVDLSLCMKREST